MRLDRGRDNEAGRCCGRPCCDELGHERRCGHTAEETGPDPADVRTTVLGRGQIGRARENRHRAAEPDNLAGAASCGGGSSEYARHSVIANDRWVIEQALVIVTSGRASIREHLTHQAPEAPNAFHRYAVGESPVSADRRLRKLLSPRWSATRTAVALLPSTSPAVVESRRSGDGQEQPDDRGIVALLVALVALAGAWLSSGHKTTDR